MSSEVYQVDLLAALFGGFMVVWLSTASESEQPSSERHQHYAVLEMAVDQDSSPIAVLPWSMHGRSCVPDSVVEELQLSLSQNVFGCQRVNRPSNTIFQKVLERNRFSPTFRYAVSTESNASVASQLLTSFSRVLDVSTSQLKLSPLGYAYQEFSGRRLAFQPTPNVAEAVLFSCSFDFSSCADRRVVQLRESISPLAVWGLQNPEVVGRLNSISLVLQDVQSSASLPSNPFVYDRIFKARTRDQRMVAAGVDQGNSITTDIPTQPTLSPNQMLRLTGESIPIAPADLIRARLCVVGPSAQECFETRPGTIAKGTIELHRV